MADDSPYEIKALSAETWAAFDDLVMRHNGIFGGCWCIWFHPDGPERGQGAEANRALKKAYVEQGKAHAALVMDAMRLRPLHDVAEPSWRLDVEVLDARARKSNQAAECAGLGCQPEQHADHSELNGH